MKKITLLLFLCISLNTIAEQPLFTKANKTYANDSIAEAITLYDSILASGRESSELYYNLGNCYYKNKDWANATGAITLKSDDFIKLILSLDGISSKSLIIIISSPDDESFL